MRKHDRLKKQGWSKKELKRADPMGTTGKHLNKLEQKVADFLQGGLLEVHKVYAPDLIVINKKTRKFCFVEVKSHRDRPTYYQAKTFKKFRMIGLPLVVVYPETQKYMSKVLNAMRKVEKSMDKKCECEAKEFTRGFAVGYALEMRRKAKEEQNEGCSVR